MREGHPFATAGLDELRAEQRRVLRSIPERVLANIEQPSASTDGDRALRELQVRRYIASEWLPMVVDLVNRLTKELEAEALFDAVRPLGSAFDLGGIHRAAQERWRATRVREFSEKETVALKQFVPLLVLAESLADDDYIDPRLQR